MIFGKRLKGFSAVGLLDGIDPEAGTEVRELNYPALSHAGGFTIADKLTNRARDRSLKLCGTHFHRLGHKVHRGVARL